MSTPGNLSFAGARLPNQPAGGDHVDQHRGPRRRRGRASPRATSSSPTTRPPDGVAWAGPGWRRPAARCSCRCSSAHRRQSGAPGGVGGGAARPRPPRASGSPACRPALKWPNDLVADERKLAGILAETTANLAVVVVGLGLNVARPSRPPGGAHVPRRRPRRPGRRRGPRGALLDALLVELARRYDDLGSVMAEYRRRCVDPRAARPGHASRRRRRRRGGRDDLG